MADAEFKMADGEFKLTISESEGVSLVVLGYGDGYGYLIKNMTPMGNSQWRARNSNSSICDFRVLQVYF